MVEKQMDAIEQAQAEYDEATGKMQAEAEAAQAEFKAQAAASRKKHYNPKHLMKRKLDKLVLSLIVQHKQIVLLLS